MKFEYDDNKLTIIADEDDKRELQEILDEDPDYFASRDATYDFFESLIANSELSWIDPIDTGDLTDAPILGILDYDESVNSKTGPYGAVDVGMGEYAPILHRWGFMDYQIRSVLEDLLEKGKVIFVASH